MLRNGRVDGLTEAHLRTAVEQSPLGTIIFDSDGRCLLVNSAWNALWSSGEDRVLAGSNIFENEQARHGAHTPLESKHG